MARNGNTAPWANPDTEFERYIEQRKVYEAAVIANGGTVSDWHGGNLDVRRDLYERRYQRPEPPNGLLTDLDAIRKTK